MPIGVVSSTKRVTCTITSLASPTSLRMPATFSPSLTSAKPTSPAKKITCRMVPLLVR
ncbi:hypothetical protein D3C86_2162820 [compost metagenome]